jgi:hypothetical protein
MELSNRQQKPENLLMMFSSDITGAKDNSD